MKKFFFKCLPVFGSSEDDTNVSAMRIMVTVNESKSCRKITLKGLYGNYLLIRTFMKFYNRKIQNKLYKGVPKDERKKRKSSARLTFDNNYNEISLIGEEEGKHNQTNAGEMGSKDTTNQKYTYYYYHKILSSDQYSLGMKVSEFIENFITEFEDAENSARMLPKPLERVCVKTNEVVRDLYSNYNISGNNKNLMQFCRASVEKFIFSKVFSTLDNLYDYKYREENEKLTKRSAVTRAVDPIDMLKHLGVNEKFIICDSFRFSNSQSTYDFKSRKDVKTDNSVDSSVISGSEDSEVCSPENRPKNWDGVHIPYHESIKALERIATLTSPRDKLD